MTKYLSLIVIILQINTAISQVSSSVISTANGHNKNEFISLDWVLGEPFIETITTKHGLFTQGFLQPLLIIEKIREVPLIRELEIAVAPNPFQYLLNIKFIKPYSSQLLLTMHNINGKILISNKIPPKQVMETINVAHLPNGTYIIKIVNQKGTLLKSFLVNKIN